MACVKLLLFEAVDERYNVLLFQAPEHFDLSQSCLFYYLIVIGLFELLYGNCMQGKLTTV